MTEPDASPTRLIMEAIARRVRLAATYNGTASILAPHVLYTRAGELYLGAVVMERNGLPPREPKLGIFKLDGMSALALVEQAFEPDRTLYDPRDPRFSETTVFAVEF
ncbi:WYL domain-containing protein [Sphingomonas jatrophae]|nr:WYL domain-containing protein [Sphingomonas jatrophae]